MIHLFLVTLLFFLSSCDQISFEEKQEDKTNQISDNQTVVSEGNSKPKDEEPKPTSEQKPNYVVTFEDFQKNFINEISPGSSPFLYDVNFKWIPFSTTYKLRIRDGNANIVESTTDVGYFKYKTNHNRKINFTIDLLDSSDRVVFAFMYYVQMPRDFVVTQDLRVLEPTEKTEKGSIYRYNRVYLNKNQSLIIKEKTNFVEINHLYTEKDQINLIENVSVLQGKEYRADPNNDGQHGSDLFLSIKNLYGRIKVVNRGQDGGHGLAGEPYSDRASTGTPAVEGLSEHVGKNDRLVCFSQGKPGGQGSTGLPGRPGLNGKNGGRSGKVSIKVETVIRGESSPIIDDIYIDQINPVIVDVKPGSKGLKGLGGPGQLGGLGGPKAKGKCIEKATEGPEGIQGPKGADGFDGKDGVKEHYCVSITSLGVNFCE